MQKEKDEEDKGKVRERGGRMGERKERRGKNYWLHQLVLFQSVLLNWNPFKLAHRSHRELSALGEFHQTYYHLFRLLYTWHLILSVNPLKSEYRKMLHLKTQHHLSKTWWLWDSEVVLQTSVHFLEDRDTHIVDLGSRGLRVLRAFVNSGLWCRCFKNSFC